MHGTPVCAAGPACSAGRRLWRMPASLRSWTSRLPPSAGTARLTCQMLQHLSEIARIYGMPRAHAWCLHRCVLRREFAQASKQVILASKQGTMDGCFECSWKLGICPLLIRRRGGRVNVSRLVCPCDASAGLKNATVHPALAGTATAATFRNSRRCGGNLSCRCCLPRRMSWPRRRSGAGGMPRSTA